MALLSRVSAAVGRSSSCSARTQLSRFNAVADLSHASKSAKSSFVRPISTQPAVEAASSAGRSSGLGNVLLGTTLVAAGVGTVYFTHLRMRHSGWGVSANTIMDDGLHPAEHPWPNNHPFATYDHASLRRGFQVYREVCSACHSLNRIAWRNLVGVTHTVDEAKAMAEELEYDDEEPDDDGNLVKRPGKLSDYLPNPYPNENAARAANAGALPPDLSLMVKARHGGADYVFSLITGYPEEPPPGVHVMEGLNYNPYFPGGAIAMARVIYDGIVEYEDGTEATASQLAKDVVHFLTWTASPEHDDRKLMGMQAVSILALLLGISIYVKKYKWLPLKTRQIRKIDNAGW